MPSPDRPGSEQASTSSSSRERAASTSAVPQETPATGPTTPPATNRRVQWIGLTENSDKPPAPSPPGHVAISVTTPEYERENPFETPEYSEKTTPEITPDNSRPPSPSQMGMDNFIDPDQTILEGETEGLPVPQNYKPKTFTREAQKLVHRHRFQFKGLHLPGHRRQASSGDSNADSESGGGGALAALGGVGASAAGIGSDAPTRPSQLPRRTATGTGPGPGPGPSSSTRGGVLSSLLKLYDHQQDQDKDKVQGHQSQTKAPVEVHADGKPKRPIHIRSHSYDNVPDVVRGGMKGLAKGVGLSVSDRPDAARSGAGVFGALHTSAFNLAGAATPVSSTVAPVPHRPGYHVSRYSANNVNDTATSTVASSTASSPGPARPQSATPPRSPPPGAGVASSAATVAGPGGLSDRHRTGSHRSLTNLADLLDPKSYHNQSRAYKTAHSPAHSQPSSPPPEFDEKFDPTQSVQKRPTTASTKDEKSEKHGHHHSHAHHLLHRGKNKKKPHKTRQEEIFITMHVAAILQRQDFILRFARALMMFGAPTHKIENQIQTTAKVLDLDCSVIYLFNVMILSFQDRDTHTSEIKFIKQPGGIDLAKLTELFTLHWEVTHDKIGVQEASVDISRLMLDPPLYNRWQTVLIGGLASVFISIASFKASFVDLCMSFVLGSFLVISQVYVATKSDVLSNIFEIVIAALISFAAAGLSSTRYFCYSAIASSSIVLILPGWLTCSAALELQSRSILCGSVRLIWAVIYALFLGFGISIGAQFWQLFSGSDIIIPNGDASGCSYARGDGVPWYQTQIDSNEWWYWLAVPGFAVSLSLRNCARIKSKEFFVMSVIGSVGWTVNHFAAVGFPGRADISSALGALAVGFLGNIWGILFQNTGFVVSVVGILFQLPSGLSNGGLLNFATNTDSTSQSWDSAFTVAQQLITVALGLVVGLFVAAVMTSPFSSKRRGGPMTF